MEAGDDVQAARLAPEVEQLPGLLPGIAELIVLPVTALSDDTVPCTDSFVLYEVGVIYLMAIREWATHAPAAAAPGIARTISHFVGQVLADAPTDVARFMARAGGRMTSYAEEAACFLALAVRGTDRAGRFSRHRDGLEPGCPNRL